MSRLTQSALLAALLLSSPWITAAPPTAAPSPASVSPATRPATAVPSAPTRAQIDALINQAGRTPPDWWDSVPLNYPNTLDLTWKDNSGPWNPQRNVGQYLWDVINPNPSRWKEGTKFVHHVLTVNKNNPVIVDRAMVSLAHLYAAMLQDYPRGAFWARRSGKNPVLLANCYWQMGSKEMATELLKKIGPDRTRNGSVIKLWADMGELPTALELAQEMAQSGMPDAAYLAAGDACRSAGQYDQATKYYQGVLASTAGGRDLEVNRKRAQASIDALRVIDLTRIADGTYTNSSLGYAGQVQVAVTVKDHHIDAVKVTQHKEKQFYASIDQTTSQIIGKQGVRGVDTTSGATVTSEAIINAAAKALVAAQK
jgi:uncharacterized protein with FMN-binding domain